MDKNQQLFEEIKKKAVNGRISCSAARELAKELKISPLEVGKACDELRIKIYGCELGCF